MQFAHEELGDLFGVVDVGIDAAGHLDARQRVGAGLLVAQRQQHAGEERLAIGEAAVAAQAHGAHGTVVEADLHAFALGIGHVVTAGGDLLQQAFEEQHVQGLRQFKARDLGRRGAQGRGGDFQARELALHQGLVAVVGKQELMEIAVLRGDRHLRAFDRVTMR